MDKDFLKSIKPKDLKESDKYSANLYKFIKKTGYDHVYIDINKGNFEKPELIDIDKDDLDNLSGYDIYIGSNIMADVVSNKEGTKSVDIGQVIAKPLWSILNGNKLYQCGCYCAFGHTYVNRDFLEITDWFWKKYKEIGRCLFIDHNSKYIIGSENRFTKINPIYRKCNWCGKLQEKKITQEYKLISEVKWEDK